MKNWQPEQDRRKRGKGAVIRKRGKWKNAVYQAGGISSAKQTKDFVKVYSENI